MKYSTHTSEPSEPGRLLCGALAKQGPRPRPAFALTAIILLIATTTLSAAAPAPQHPATQPSTTTHTVPPLRSGQAAQPVSTQPSTFIQPWTHYKIIVDRDIFLPGSARRQHGQDLDDGDKAATPSHVDQPAPPGAAWTLTGVVLLAGRQVAFLANSQTGQTKQVSPGDATPVGRLVRVTMDRITIDVAGKPRPIRIGQRLDGQAAPATQPTNANAATTAPTAGEATLIQKLRAQRQKQLHE